MSGGIDDGKRCTKLVRYHRNEAPLQCTRFALLVKQPIEFGVFGFDFGGSGLNKLLKLVAVPSHFVLISRQRLGSINKPPRYEDGNKCGKPDSGAAEGGEPPNGG